MRFIDRFSPSFSKTLLSLVRPRLSRSNRADGECAGLDWINDLAIGRYAHATESLVGEATKEQSLAQKKVGPSSLLSWLSLTCWEQLMLSIGKLSEVAQATKNTIDTRSVQEKIEGQSFNPSTLHDSADSSVWLAVVDDLLDVIQVQETTQKLFYELLAGTDLRLDTGKQGEVLTSRAAPGLHNRPAFAQVRSSVLLPMRR